MEEKDLVIRIEQFFNAELSVEEERELCRYLSENEVPAELRKDKEAILLLCGHGVEGEVPAGAQERIEAMIDALAGEETELDRTVVDEIGDPLMHLLRNAADHGLESAEVRAKRGKPAVGSIFLDAYQDGNNVVIEVKDDGNGGYTTIKLINYSESERYTEVWSILSAVYYDCMLNDLWTLSPVDIPDSPAYFMPFEIGKDLKFDEEKMQADIEKYGLYTYEDFADYMTYEQFVGFGFANWKVAVGKGAITWEEILHMISIHLS